MRGYGHCTPVLLINTVLNIWLSHTALYAYAKKVYAAFIIVHQPDLLLSLKDARTPLRNL